MRRGGSNDKPHNFQLLPPSPSREIDRLTSLDKATKIVWLQKINPEFDFSLYDYLLVKISPLGNQDKTWALHKICNKCCLGLHN